MPEDAVEQSRRAWAAMQDPPLATTLQVAEMLRHKRATQVGRIMWKYDVDPVVRPGDPRPDSPYYDYGEAARAVSRYKMEGPALRAESRAQARSATTKQQDRLAAVQVVQPHKSGWTQRQLEMAWQDQVDALSAVALLFRRCPSFPRFSFSEAKAFVAVLSGHLHQMDKIRFDRDQFIDELRKLTRDAKERAAAERAINSYYGSTANFSRLDPAISAAVILELVRTAPAR